MAARRIGIDFSQSEDGADSIAADLAEFKVNWAWLLRELYRLTDEDILQLFSEDPLGQAGPEGRWGLLELDPYWLICQLQVDERYWQLGIGEGMLKIAGLVPRRDEEKAIAELRRHEDEDDRRRKQQEKAARRRRRKGRRGS